MVYVVYLGLRRAADLIDRNTDEVNELKQRVDFLETKVAELRAAQRKRD